MVFETHACDHTWKKDLQQCALAEALSLFIPPFPIAMELFSANTRFTHEMDEKGLCWGDWSGERVRVVAFQLLYKPSEPSLSGPWSLLGAAFRPRAIEGLFIS